MFCLWAVYSLQGLAAQPTLDQLGNQFWRIERVLLIVGLSSVPGTSFWRESYFYFLCLLLLLLEMLLLTTAD